MDQLNNENTNGQISSSTNFSNLIIGLLLIIIAVLTFNFFKTSGDSSSTEDPSTNTIVPVVTQSPTVSETNSPDNNQNTNMYTVTKGDSLWKIAVKQYNNGFLWTEIAKSNNIDLNKANQLTVGTQLLLPEVASSQTGTENSALTDETTQPASQIYKVQKGDTLWRIAVDYYGNGFDWTKIYNNPENKLSMHTSHLGTQYPDLEPGMTLYIPVN